MPFGITHITNVSPSRVLLAKAKRLAARKGVLECLSVQSGRDQGHAGSMSALHIYVAGTNEYVQNNSKVKSFFSERSDYLRRYVITQPMLCNSHFMPVETRVDLAHFHSWDLSKYKRPPAASPPTRTNRSREKSA